MSRALLSGLATVALVFAASAASPAPAATPDHVYGPEPSWPEFRKLAEAEVATRLIDPESARFTWVTGIHKGSVKPFLSATVAGWIACGAVNAKNRMGGYTGAITFVVAIDYGRVLTAALDTRPYGLYSEACAKWLASGLYPPPPPADAEPVASAALAADATIADAKTGLSLRAMPDGAYVAAVTPASPAALAGLTPGMVITSVNAVPLAGLGEAMLKVVSAAGPTASLALVGGKTIKLGARP